MTNTMNSFDSYSHVARGARADAARTGLRTLFVTAMRDDVPRKLALWSRLALACAVWFGAAFSVAGRASETPGAGPNSAGVTSSTAWSAHTQLTPRSRPAQLDTP